MRHHCARSVRNVEPLTASDKRRALQRGRQACGICETLLDVFDTDHIVPRAAGGSNRPENLMALCPTCHRRKSAAEAKRIREYKRMVAFVPRTYRLCWWCLHTHRAGAAHECPQHRDILEQVRASIPDYDRARHRTKRRASEDVPVADEDGDVPSDEVHAAGEDEIPPDESIEQKRRESLAAFGAMLESFRYVKPQEPRE